MPLYGEAKRKYQRDWMANRRQAWIDSKGGCCAKCSSTKDLEVDHINPALKTMQPSWIWSRNEAAVVAELANCQVLCAECHANKTYGSIKVKHGTTTAYAHHKCRCDTCRAAHAAYSREWRARVRNKSLIAA
jgi:hypothetical protein